mgnify:CR=1 FL=1
MKISLKNLPGPMLITTLVLILSEILTTTVMPIIGMDGYRLSFNILIVLYICFKLETSIMSVLIFIIQYFHSFFTIEGWAMGTIAGIIVCMVISYLRDLIHLSSFWITVFITQVFQMIWFLILTLLIYVKMGDEGLIISKLGRFLPESIFLSIISPFAFKLLDFIWKSKEREALNGSS